VVELVGEAVAQGQGQQQHEQAAGEHEGGL
jgi:hypothetical protein